MLAFVQIYLLVFGILAIVGGVMGFVKAKSKPSLIAGGLAGVLLIAAHYLIATDRPQPGLILGFVLCLALAGRFVPAYLKTKKPMPAGMMAALSVVGIVAIGLSFAR